MGPEEFRSSLLRAVNDALPKIQTHDGDWTIKGFIDVFRNIYTMSADTKVLSKVLELMLFPAIAGFCAQNSLESVLAAHQNHYPDYSLIAAGGTKIALDIKTTYRKGPGRISRCTLGTFRGYFRDRQSWSGITFPYAEYAHHFVLAAVYTRRDPETLPDERQTYRLDDLASIASVATDFEFLLHEKYRVASDTPGSGNTRNIGSVSALNLLVSGKGPFAALGPRIFDDYWMNYMDQQMARDADLPAPPYTNIQSYLEFKKLPAAVGPDQIDQLLETLQHEAEAAEEESD